MSQTSDIIVACRVPRALAKAIAKAAKADHRTVSSYVHHVLAVAVLKRKTR